MASNISQINKAFFEITFYCNWTLTSVFMQCLAKLSLRHFLINLLINIINILVNILSIVGGRKNKFTLSKSFNKMYFLYFKY